MQQKKRGARRQEAPKPSKWINIANKFAILEEHEVKEETAELLKVAPDPTKEQKENLKSKEENPGQGDERRNKEANQASRMQEMNTEEEE